IFSAKFTLFVIFIKEQKKIDNRLGNMSKASQKNTTQQTLFNTLNNKNKKQQLEDSADESKNESSPLQLRKSSRIQQQRIIQEQQSIAPQKKQSAKINSKQKLNNQKTQGSSQTTLNYLRKDSNNLQTPQIQSQSLSQDISSIQSTIPSPSINIPKKQNQQLFQKVISDINYELIVQKIEKFQPFISSLVSNITNYMKEQKNEKQQKLEINVDKIEKMIKYILFRFITSSPFSMWSNLYSPQRVSQLIEESNGQLIQLWIRKYYKGIKDKQKGESLFGYVDSDDDFSEYFDNTSNNSNMNEEYTKLLNSNACKNWKNKGNILILNGREGCGKTTALKAAIKSLKMQIIEINNSMKRGGTDLKKITEITQSCVLQNGSSTNNEKQQNQNKKGTLNSFFVPIKKIHSQNTQESDQQDQINIDAKDSSKKVIYFRNFDIQLDTLFQNEVLKLSENSKVPFILSINQDNEQNLKGISLQDKDIVQFQPISYEQITIFLYIIFEVERNYRKYHFMNPLYIANLVKEDNENLQDSEMQKEQKESKEDILLQSEEFNTFMINFPSDVYSEKQHINTISKLVHMFNGDLQTCLSFVQDNIKIISQRSEFATISKSIDYNQLRNIKLNNLNQIFLTDIPIQEINDTFKFNTENTYQIFLNSSHIPCSDYSEQQLEDSFEIRELQNHLMNLENVQALDLLNSKLENEKLNRKIFKESLNTKDSEQELFYNKEKKIGIEKFCYKISQLKDDINLELQTLCKNINSNYPKNQQKQADNNKNIDLIVVSNFLQNNLNQTVNDLQDNIFYQQYKNYNVCTDKAEKSDKFYIKKSLIKQYFQIIPVLDTIKTNYNISSKRTRSQYNKTQKDIATNPLSIVEQTISKSSYAQFKLLLSQFNLRKQNSFSQNYQKDNQNIQNISNTLNVLSLQISQQSDSSQSSLENEENIQVNEEKSIIHQKKTENIEDQNKYDQQQIQDLSYTDQKYQQTEQQKLEEQNQITTFQKYPNINIIENKDNLKDKEMEVEYYDNQNESLKQDSENVDPNINSQNLINERDSKQKLINDQNFQYQQNQVSQIAYQV
ncbi:hypothetical protein TTHERM_00487170, partial (macronuclear) [Tetrahymena thermophila SB210]